MRLGATKYLHMDLVYAFKNVETFKKELLVVFQWMKLECIYFLRVPVGVASFISVMASLPS